MKTTILATCAAAITFCVASAASAASVTVGDARLTPTKTLADTMVLSFRGAPEAKATVKEYETGPYRGTYDLSVGAGLKIWGFGVSNNDKFASPKNNNDSCCGSAIILDSSNWNTYELDYSGTDSLTGYDIWGDMSNVLDTGDTHFFWFDDYEVGYETGEHSGFEFFAQTASKAIAVGVYGQKKVYGQSVSASPVPLPAAGWMLVVGLGGLAATRRRKT